MTDTQSAAAAALAGDTAPTPTPTPAQTPGGVKAAVDPAATPAATWQAPDWAKDLPTEDLGYLEKKKFDDPKNLLKSYRELERTLSDDRVAIPKDWNDPAQVDKFFSKVGRPDSADKYVAPKDADPALFKALAPGLHEAGLTQAQVEKAAAAYNKAAQEQMSQQLTKWIGDENAAQAKLEREWGQNTPAEVEHNRRAMRAIGMSVDEAQAAMRASGAEKFLRLLNMAGHLIAEDNSGDIASEQTLGFGMTANRASAELAELRNNKDFMARVHGGDATAKAKYNRLIASTADAGLVRNTIKSNFRKMPET